VFGATDRLGAAAGSVVGLRPPGRGASSGVPSVGRFLRWRREVAKRLRPARRRTGLQLRPLPGADEVGRAPDTVLPTPCSRTVLLYSALAPCPRRCGERFDRNDLRSRGGGLSPPCATASLRPAPGCRIPPTGPDPTYRPGGPVGTDTPGGISEEALPFHVSVDVSGRGGAAGRLPQRLPQRMFASSSFSRLYNSHEISTATG